jgi:subtilisin family serine protease
MTENLEGKMMEPILYYRKASFKSIPQNRIAEIEIDSKISPAFHHLIEERDSEERQEAIVIHKIPESSGLTTRNERQNIYTRAAVVDKWTTVHRNIQNTIFTRYQEHVEKYQGNLPLNARYIGGGILPMAVVEVTKSTLPILAAIPEVLAVIPNYDVQPIRPVAVKYKSPSAPELKAGLTWGLETLEIRKMWEITKGNSIRVAVIDSGVDGNHPVLKDRVKEFVVIDRYGNRLEAKHTFDFDGHGTHVCGTIAGSKTPDNISIGVAPEAELIVAVYSRSIIGILEGISWAVENKADIINMSIGIDDNEDYEKISFLFNDRIRQYGIIPVVAIGNLGHGSSGFPGNDYRSFAVGAVHNIGGKIGVAPFSGGVSLIFPDHPTHKVITKPDVVAPGVNTYSCIPSRGLIWKTHPYAYLQGTSMATPHVAGATALLMSAHPKVPAQHIVDALKKTAYYPYGNEKRPDTRWGYGLIRPFEAHKALK